MAQETVRIVENGCYELADGQQVDLRKEIDDSLAATQLIRPGDFGSLMIPRSNHRGTDFEVHNETTLTAARRLVVERQLDNVLCLNFASAKNPGGGYLGGSQAQEESLARSSALVKTLESQWEYYDFHRSCGISVYSDHMILSPDVPVFRADDGALLDRPYLLSILTSPAVNAGAVIKNEPQRAAEIEPKMAARIGKLLKLAAAKNYQHLILGAWGCGVFRNEPEMIARLFAETLKIGGAFENQFTSITFAVLDGTEHENIIGPFRALFQ
ncbi:TIGR02452 family protein [Bremerella volcania]|uniref:TIGR02452 family protein n=1 Tax=Bremerella volcania TaxID=2527984 RepID=UPI0013FCF5F6|nr:TIGR02452 family protein [Bremerella volcania]